jgi:hypothetical protein
MNLAFRVSGTIMINRISQDYMKIIAEINQRMLNNSYDREIVRM